MAKLIKNLIFKFYRSKLYKFLFYNKIVDNIRNKIKILAIFENGTKLVISNVDGVQPGDILVSPNPYSSVDVKREYMLIKKINKNTIIVKRGFGNSKIKECSVGDKLYKIGSNK